MVERQGNTATVTVNGRPVTITNVNENTTDQQLQSIAERSLNAGINKIDLAQWQRTASDEQIQQASTRARESGEEGTGEAPAQQSPATTPAVGPAEAGGVERQGNTATVTVNGRPVTITNVNENTTDQQLQSIAERSLNAGINKIDLARWQLTEVPEMPEGPESDLGGMLGGFVRGAGPTAAGAAVGGVAGAFGGPASPLTVPVGAAIGGASAALAPIIGDPVTRFVNKTFGTNFTEPSQALSQLFTRMGVPEPDTKAEQVMQQAAQGAASAVVAGPLAQAIAGALSTSPVATPGTAQAIAEQIARSSSGPAAGPAAAGEFGGAFAGEAAAQLAADAGAGELGQALAGTAGSMLGGGLVEFGLEARRGARTATSNRAIRNGSAPIELTRSELRPATTQAGEFIQQWPDKIVSGTGEIRYRRFNDNQNKLINLLDSYDVEVDSLGNVPDFSVPLMNDFIETRGRRLSENTGLRDEVIQKLSTEGDPVPTPTGVNTIDDIIAREIDLGADPQSSEVRYWVDLRERIQGKRFDQLEAIRRRFGERITNDQLPDQFQKDLRDVYHSVLGTYERGADGELIRVPGDIDAYINERGTEADLNQFLVANRNLHNMAQEFESKALSGILDEWTKSPNIMRPEEITDALFSQDASTVRQLYADLSDDGRAVARQALVSKFGETADTNDLSPSRFAESVQSYGAQVGVFFDEDQVQELEGMKQWFDMTQRSELVRRQGQGFQGLPTSAVPGSGTLQSMAVRGSPQAGLIGGVVGIAGLGRLARYIEMSPQLKRQFRELATLDPDTGGAGRLARMISNAIEGFNRAGDVEPRNNEQALTR